MSSRASTSALSTVSASASLGLGKDREQLVHVAHGAGPLRRHEVAEQLAHEGQPVRADAVERRLGVLRERPGDAADGVVRRAREEALLAVAAVPERGRREGEERQRPALPLDGVEHVRHERLVLEAVAALQGGLDERAPERVAGGRPERDEVLEDRPQRLVLLAAEEEVVPHRQEDVDVGLQREPGEEGGEAGLHLGRVESEELLELVDDDERLGVVAPPPAEEVHRDVGVVEADHLPHGGGVARDLGASACPSATNGASPGVQTRCAHPSGFAGIEPGPQEAALARAGGSDDGEEVPLRQPLPDPLDLGLAAEEVLRPPPR